MEVLAVRRAPERRDGVSARAVALDDDQLGSSSQAWLAPLLKLDDDVGGRRVRGCCPARTTSIRLLLSGRACSMSTSTLSRPASIRSWAITGRLRSQLRISTVPARRPAWKSHLLVDSHAERPFQREGSKAAADGRSNGKDDPRQHEGTRAVGACPVQEARRYRCRDPSGGSGATSRDSRRHCTWPKIHI